MAERRPQSMIDPDRDQLSPARNAIEPRRLAGVLGSQTRTPFCSLSRSVALSLDESDYRHKKRKTLRLTPSIATAFSVVARSTRIENSRARPNLLPPTPPLVGGRDRNRARLAVGEAVPALSIAERVHSLTMAHVSRRPPKIPDGQVSRVRFQTLAYHPWTFPRLG